MERRRNSIFEGDKCILATFDYNGLDTQHEVVVKYLGGAFYFVNEKEEFYMCVAEVEDTENDVVVIGSIHDNPELLEGGKGV
ncbi:MAG: YopX family protein [Anaerotignum sp.]|nr:YopX family protein [Anaerotignum sp.]